MLPDKVASKHVKFFLHDFRFPALRAVRGMLVTVTVTLPRFFCVFPSKFLRKRDSAHNLMVIHAAAGKCFFLNILHTRQSKSIVEFP